MDRESKNKANPPYDKPKLRTIPLVAEEVLAVACKSAAGAPGKSGASGRCGFAPCSVPGAYGS